MATSHEMRVNEMRESSMLTEAVISTGGVLRIAYDWLKYFSREPTQRTAVCKIDRRDAAALLHLGT